MGTSKLVQWIVRSAQSHGLGKFAPKAVCLWWEGLTHLWRFSSALLVRAYVLMSDVT